ncbi:MAG: hypothetical protein AB7O52_12890 [Planctomycetota bacterium]
MLSARRRFLGTVGLLALAVVAPGGCSSSGTSTATTPDVKPSLAAQKYERVFLLQPGGPETDDALGFLGESFDVTGKAQGAIYRVYDNGFTMLGYYLESGATYAVDGGGESRFLGNHTRQRSLELIYGKTGNFRFEPHLNRS